MSKTCFVVMGFGEKPDYATGRTLNLDKTYRVIIRPAVEDAGLRCIRADDVIHSGIIDKPMYELLLSADVVVADLSTANPNALYELGVRHALRPHTTVVLAEKEFRFPFDLKSLLIRHYEHLGKGIDAEEAEKVRTELTAALRAMLAQPEVDSPIFTFLPDLAAAEARALTMRTAQATQVLAAAPQAAPADPADPAAPPAPAAAPARPAADDMLDLFREARREGDWMGARRILKKMMEDRPHDTYLTQQLALATYKSALPDPLAALRDAHTILQGLNPSRTTDPETLGLWGAVHKRLWEIERERPHLDEAIRAYEKGFYLNDDYYTGINLAYLLNERAALSSTREAIADTVTAERIRRRVIEICERVWAAISAGEAKSVGAEETFWLLATLVEAYTGIGRPDIAAKIEGIAEARAPEGWMVGSMYEQRQKLLNLLAAAPAS